jgi:hypothetical protein
VAAKVALSLLWDVGDGVVEWAEVTPVLVDNL